ncbi:MAG: 1-acyl-sn-glycerol-3-phosphate acyltransferase [Streptosporangiales bacterium]|nr:1-acyl-sn-glycerol-3-phosphate acyltransferase [Streptosporangiales bacterium]
MLPPPLIRRLLLAPLAVLVAAALAALAPAVALLSAVFSLLRRADPGRPHRWRAARVAFLALAWSAGETAALTVLLGLWIASGFGGRLDTEPYRARHYEVMRWFLDLVYGAAERSCGLRVRVDGPESGAGGRPLIVLSRHAGPGDSLLLARYLLSVCGRRPRVVMKAALQLDPSLDIVANRVPNAFLRRGGGRYRVEQIRRLAAGLGPGGALLLFPEGGNWTPLRWRRAGLRLRRRGHAGLADRAAAMPNLLPPRESGAFAALAACPDADVVFVAHTGLDRLVSVRDVWRSLSADMEVRARWWLVPSAGVPRDAAHEEQVRWLYDWWARLDAWITEQRAP